MSAWIWIVAACAIAFATKFVGFLVPESVLDSPIVRQVSAACTVGLLSALVVTNTFTAGQDLVLDARVVALLAAATALAVRIPFIGVVAIGAVAAAVARWFGMP